LYRFVLFCVICVFARILIVTNPCSVRNNNKNVTIIVFILWYLIEHSDKYAFRVDNCVSIRCLTARPRKECVQHVSVLLVGISSGPKREEKHPVYIHQQICTRSCIQDLVHYTDSVGAGYDLYGTNYWIWRLAQR
jgi:hypothetical protein